MRAAQLFIIVFAAFATGTLSACQTSRAVSFAYHDATYGGETYKASDKTSVIFLVDGLSSEILRTALRNRTVPAIADAFSLTEKARFSYGRASFPSLTFPNITSILTGHSIAEHPILGNRIVVDGSVVNFENVTNWQALALLLQRKTIFYQLAKESQSSVSYSYAFSGGATAFQWKSTEAAVSYLENDYASIDSQTLASLQSLLTEMRPSKWPRFIFVHLIGVDATAHTYGPLDERVQNYLQALDSQLHPIFHVLDHPGGTSVSNRPVNYALTADHGFRTTREHARLEDVVSRMNRKLRLVSDNRVAPLYIDEPMSEIEKLALAKALLEVPHVGWAALRTEGGIDLLKRNGDRARVTFAQSARSARTCPHGERAARFEWIERGDGGSSGGRSVAQLAFTCLSDFDLATSTDDDSYVVPALADYFANPQAPDIVFVPDDHSDFATGYLGNHGGLSREEMLVPVLTKDVDMVRGIHPTSDLLRTMGLIPSP
jgi:hypothetical protein